MAEELDLGDARVEFMAEYALKTLKLKADKFQKMYSLEENKQMFLNFLDKPDQLHILIFNNTSGQLSVSLEWPQQLKQKALYFVKRGKENVSKDNVRTALIYGDLSASPVDQLSTFVDEVLVPLLGNEKNHESWPQVVTDDVKRHVHNLKSSVYVVSGQVKGKTLLPLPVGADRIEEVAEQDGETNGHHRALIHAIETVIIEWTHQVREVLKKDSSQPLLEGQNPNPYVELEFWKSKAVNLECIYDQLREPTVRRMAELLEKANSSYFPTFKSLFRDVVAALTEAQDINLHLRPLQNTFQDLEQADYDRSERLIAPMFHTICLVWSNSQYYNTPGRIVVLLQEICNFIMELVG